jgi:hypothetical protein
MVVLGAEFLRQAPSPLQELDTAFANHLGYFTPPSALIGPHENIEVTAQGEEQLKLLQAMCLSNR